MRTAHTATRCPAHRPAFTLIEMMVSTALVLFIMVIMSEAFSKGLEAFRTLKTVGDMNEKLRAATTVLRNDLVADHFGNQKPLSKQTLPLSPSTGAYGFFRVWQGSPLTAPTAATPNPPYASEGSDPDGMPSARATDHMLHFTVDQTGNRRENYYSAWVQDGALLPSLANSGGPTAYRDGNNYNGQWIEVAYFLRPTGEATTNSTAGASTTPLYALYRRARLAVTTTEATGTAGPPPTLGWNNGVLPGARALVTNLNSNYFDMSAAADPTAPTYVYFNTPADLTMPVRRFGMQPLTVPPTLPGTTAPEQPNYAGMPNQYSGTYGYPLYSDNSAAPAVMPGADVLLTDVISFEVKVLPANIPSVTDFVDLFTFDSAAYASYSGLNPAFTGPTKPRAFDTWTNAKDNYYDYSTSAGLLGSPSTGTYRSVPLNITVQALQITLRVWDPKTQNSRQITIRQNM